MKRFLLLIPLFLLGGCLAEPSKTLQPVGTYLVPDISRDQYEAILEQMDMGRISSEEADKYYASPIFRHFYSNACSWYCAGLINDISGSSSFPLTGVWQHDFFYAPQEAHDFNHETAWVPAKSVGEYITYTVPANCPKINTIKILNGMVKSDDAWRYFARVKRLKMYLNDKALAILELEDSRSLQWFDIGEVGAENATEWRLKFEILEVYSGKIDQPAISELYFDGEHTH